MKQLICLFGVLGVVCMDVNGMQPVVVDGYIKQECDICRREGDRVFKLKERWVPVKEKGWWTRRLDGSYVPNVAAVNGGFAPPRPAYDPLPVEDEVLSSSHRGATAVCCPWIQGPNGTEWRQYDLLSPRGHFGDIVSN